MQGAVTGIFPELLEKRQSRHLAYRLNEEMTSY